MQKLLEVGPPDGIDADEFEAALQIVEAFKVLTSGLDYGSARADGADGIRSSTNTMSDRDAETCAVWFAWSALLPVGSAAHLVDQIEDHAPILDVASLRWACHQWDRLKRDRHRSHRVDSDHELVMTMRVGQISPNDIPAKASNLPARPRQPLPALSHLPNPPTSHSVEMRASNAHATAVPPTTRPRR